MSGVVLPFRPRCPAASGRAAVSASGNDAGAVELVTTIRGDIRVFRLMQALAAGGLVIRMDQRGGFVITPAHEARRPS